MSAHYQLSDHVGMVSDTIRMEAYRTAIQASVHPGNIVVDLGAGLGLFGLLACQLGARRVYAIEAEPTLVAARRIAQANGFSDRMTFIRGRSTDVTLPEPADVVIADMRGVMPLHGANVACMADARARLLRPDGRLVQQRDHLMVAPVRLAGRHDAIVGRWNTPVFGFDLSAVVPYASQVPARALVSNDDLLGTALRWATIEYGVDRPSFEGGGVITASRAGAMHGLAAWFESELFGGVRYSSGPGGATAYSQAFFPLQEAVPVDVGDRIGCRLIAAYDGADYQWSWTVEIGSPGQRLREVARQTTLAPAALFRDRRH